MRLGIDILIEERPELLKGQRVGVLAHQASLDAKGRHTVERISGLPNCTLTALFGPEHGILTLAQDMESVATTQDSGSGVPIYSLYGSTLESLKPTKAMLERIDTLVVDLQDIGSRYYTYTWTALLAAEACAEHGKKLVLCDRPNPIGGELVEGGAIEAGFESFVGLSSIPVRHGMTMAEIVHWLNIRDGIDANIEVLRMQGWQRGQDCRATGIPWVNPSPNMRSFSAALLYPGMCLIEATNISEGRGTDTPFEICGAPWFDSDQFIEAFEALHLPGIHAAPTSFIPTRQKWRSQLCNGVRWVISDATAFRPYLTGLCFLWLAHKLYKDSGFEWRAEPYEFVTDRPAIDLLTGSGRFREAIEALTLPELAKLSQTPEQMLLDRSRVLLY